VQLVVQAARVADRLAHGVASPQRRFVRVAIGAGHAQSPGGGLKLLVTNLLVPPVHTYCKVPLI
jgi:hypothetical protein